MLFDPSRKLALYGDLAIDKKDVIAVSIFESCSRIVLTDGSLLNATVESGRQLLEALSPSGAEATADSAIT